MIFAHSNYRDWLQAELTQRREENPAYSAQAFALRLGLSQAYMSLLMSGRRKLTNKTACLLAEKLKLNESEQRYLRTLIQKEKHTGTELEAAMDSELAKIRKENELTPLNLERFRVMSDWYYSAILELINVDGVPHSGEAFARELGIPVEHAKEAIGTLLRLNLIKREEGKFHRSDEGYLATPTEIFSKALQRFHMQMLTKSREAIKNQSVDQRAFTGMTMSIDPKRLPEAKRRIQKFSEELMEFLEGGERKAVYQLSLQLFQLNAAAEMQKNAMSVDESARTTDGKNLDMKDE